MLLSKSWDPLVEKFRKRLATWKASALTIGGRSTLVKSVLGSLGTYWFSIFEAPKSVIEKLESLRRDFFWGKTGKRNAIPWVKWEATCAETEKGGLGLGNLTSVNKSLLAKWTWRFKNEQSAPWVNIIKSIHGKTGLLNKENWLAAKNSNWKKIIGVVHQAADDGIDLLQNLKYNIGNGLSVLFWQDNWHEEGLLKDQFPNLFALEEDKTITVAGFINRVDGLANWRNRLGNGRSASGWRLMLDKIINTKLSIQPDSLRCLDATDGIFSVSWFRERWDNQQQAQDGEKTKWIKWIPRKENIFMWRMNRGRIPTKDNLIKMKIQVEDDQCPLCNSHSESLNHLFFDCSFASVCWDNFFRWWDFPVQYLKTAEDLETWISSLKKNGRMEKCIRVTVAAICKEIWNSRNGAIFRGVKCSLTKSVRSFKEMALSWFRSRSSKVVIDCNGWNRAPNFLFL